MTGEKLKVKMAGENVKITLTLVLSHRGRGKRRVKSQKSKLEWRDWGGYFGAVLPDPF